MLQHNPRVGMEGYHCGGTPLVRGVLFQSSEKGLMSTVEPIKVPDGNT